MVARVPSTNLNAVEVPSSIENISTISLMMPSVKSVAKVAITVIASLVSVAAYLYKGSYIGVASVLASLLVNLYIWSNKGIAQQEPALQQGAAPQEEAAPQHRPSVDVGSDQGLVPEEDGQSAEQASLLRRPLQLYYIVGGRRIYTASSTNPVDLHNIIARNAAAQVLMDCLNLNQN